MEQKTRVGIDLGGTKIEAVVLNESNEPVWRRRVATEAWKGYAHIVERVAELAAEACSRTGRASPPVGVGTPGAVRANGTMKNCNTTCLNGRPLPGDLQDRLGRAVRVENDANCFALAESLCGAGQNFGLVFGVILGTGVGGGVVYRGELLRGAQGIAGEWGHHSVDPAGPDCYCGQRGCVESFISGPAVAAQYERRTGRSLTTEQIVAEAGRGDAHARDVLGEFLARFGRALANVIDILDPDIVVLGGGLSNFDGLYTEGRAAVGRYVFNDELRTPIVRHRLGDSAGVIGAALLT